MEENRNGALEEIGVRVQQFGAKGDGEANIKDFGATGNGTTDDYSALVKVLQESNDVLLPSGVYLIGSDVTIDVTKQLRFGANACLKPANGVTITFNGGIDANYSSWIFDTSLGGVIGGNPQVEKVSVRWFGTSWANAFQLATDLVSSNGGGKVFIPSGTYIFDKKVTPRSGVHYEGNGTSTVITASKLMLAVFQNDINGPDIDSVTWKNIRFVGGVVDEGEYPRHERTSSPNMQNSIYLSGSLLEGINFPKVSNITIRECWFENIETLPFILRGVSGESKVTDCHLSNNMDAGFVWCETVIFTDNYITKSADNGVSISRACEKVICNDNIIDLSCYAGIWLSGWLSGEPNNPVPDAPGPKYFECSGNTITNSGMSGISLADAPQYGSVVGNTIDTVFRGTVDVPQDNYGNGIVINNFPSTAYNNDGIELYAEGILVADNTIRKAQRNGIHLRGSKGVKLSDNLIIDCGAETYLDGSVIGATNRDRNVGICLDATATTTISNIFILDNVVIDTRQTPLCNYAVIAVGVSNCQVLGNRQSNLRNPLISGLSQDIGNTNILENELVAQSNSGNVTGYVGAETGSNRRMGFLKKPGVIPILAIGASAALEVHVADKPNITDPAAKLTKLFTFSGNGRIYFGNDLSVDLFREGNTLKTSTNLKTSQNLQTESSAWNAGHLTLGTYHFWVDATGKLRIKNGSPTSDTDGTVV
ncbi:right-handed parallel beta-helix repeat-containing protein [Paenibacillus medicaginis]|uniref:Right-handed parallel beta-helix repeat-containing protein n=1 Tax=Paenibacillus medicaginis TaxID=1470560 RepID=A0ABV5C1R6_9BACL